MMTTYEHIPVMRDRVLELLGPALGHEGALLVDATLGLGGHAEAFLEANGFAAVAVPKRGVAPSAHAESNPALETARAFPFQRGDWVRYGRHGMGRIVSVAERAKQFEVTIEDASSLQHKRINPAKVALKPLE